ncbi:MAG: ABC transporter ATP-binding protein [Deltaproteobacteria bacterium]|nr:MAG: ABC transporter ATP-binding protein [Deltaproteobacteria bacterium]
MQHQEGLRDVTADVAANVQAPLLRICGVTVRFGAIVALNDVSFDVRRGEILGLIGPNGAGKTTLFNCLSRLVDVERGTIELDGQPLLAAARHDIAGVGIGRTFQNLALFETMSVIDNVLVGTHVRGRGGFLSDAFRIPSLVEGERRARDHARALIERLELTAVARTPVGGLPFAIKKRVELARALAAEPKLLLLDEPAGGLNHEEVGHLGDQIRTLRDAFGVTILMVEHHLNFVMQVSDRVVALDFGKTLAEGTPAEMQRHPEVIRAYLGAPT